MEVGEYIKEAARGRHEWGVRDCCLWPADWVMLCRGFDPAAKWRGRYSTEAEALAFIEHEGGMLNMWSGVLPLPRTATPKDGDVGVIMVHGDNGPVANGGIFADKRWSFVAPNGLFRASIAPEFVLAVWDV